MSHAKDRSFAKLINGLADAIASQEVFFESAEGLTEMIAAIIKEGKIVATGEDIEKAAQNGNQVKSERQERNTTSE